MEMSYEYHKCTVLYVDDEELALKYFTRAFENEFPILIAASAAEGYRLLEQHRDRIGLCTLFQLGSQFRSLFDIENVFIFIEFFFLLRKILWGPVTRALQSLR